MAKKGTAIRVMYQGERVDTFGRIHQMFRDVRGENYQYSGIRDVSFGQIYPMTDGKMAVYPIGEYDPKWKPTDKEEREFEAHKIVVADRRARRKAEMQLKKPNPKIVQAVDLLRPFYLAMTDWDRDRFIRWVSQECSKRKGRR